ncbi:MAG: hypothetical protein EI684_02830 [Candidatus Viridilinea halotolerans]|uniref:Uncharacterized protein n=1 Tax=Candidatus Viridilinea halotolerans TaxID=2491704 RepID=A0A426U8M6_9CHLR|nr:MAG: hypothetical protein EI684_02830 [Candidatus Viridilinea halotolerans]
MRIELPEQLKIYIQYKIDIGLYSNGAEVIRDALRRMMEQDAEASRTLRPHATPQSEAAQISRSELDALANAFPAPLPPMEEDPHLLALIARIKATPPNPASIIPAKGDLAEVLRVMAQGEPDYELLDALDAAEQELRALDRANARAEGRGSL